MSKRKKPVVAPSGKGTATGKGLFTPTWPGGRPRTKAKPRAVNQPTRLVA